MNATDKPTQVLFKEHRVIEQVLSCLEKMVEGCRAGQGLDCGSVLSAVEFFQAFADRCHHAKEEDILFPAMEAKGFPRAGGPTGVMLHEHEQGRALVKAVAAAAEGAAAGNPDAVEAFVTNAAGFVGLLRTHIEKEDHCLFGMAEEALSSAEQSQMLEHFDKADAAERETGSYQRCIEIARDLALRYNVAQVEGTDLL